MLRIFIVALFVLLSGCATGGGREYRPGNIAAAGNATVYVYRPWAFPASGYTALLTLDAQPAKSLKNASYIVFQVAPGRHVLRTVKQGFRDWGGKVQELSFDAAAGQICFVKYNVSGNSVVTGAAAAPVVFTSTLNLSVVPPHLAEGEISSLRESD